MDKVLLITTTVGSAEEAEKLAESVIEKRLAGCAQISGPVTSLYWWQGKMEKEQEYSVMLKSTESLYRELEQFLKEIHPYETPEIIAVPVTACSEAYGKWLLAELKSVTD